MKIVDGGAERFLSTIEQFATQNGGRDRGVVTCRHGLWNSMTGAESLNPLIIQVEITNIDIDLSMHLHVDGISKLQLTECNAHITGYTLQVTARVQSSKLC
jgi:hypothetical protein